jgi:aldose 1-epimerase
LSNRAEIFDHLPDGRAVECVRIAGPMVSARLLTLGATVQDLRLAGTDRSLVLGFADSAAYLDGGIYAGAIVGRFANRIAHGRFRLDGRDHQVDRNHLSRHLLHGGVDGTHRQLWWIADLHADRATLTLTLPDGHMGFPGTLRIAASFSVSDDALSIELSAEADAPTPVNLAHHSYFNLDGEGDIRGHILRIDAESYLPVDADLIPTGEIAAVAETAFDFREPRPIGDGGYDHNFCLAVARRPLRPVAWLCGRGGLAMTIETTEPGLQLYDGRHFAGIPGLDGRVHGPYAGVALETQGWPDAPNHQGFPDCILRPGQEWRSRTNYRFGR